MRWVSRQFDDDANQNALASYCSTDLRLTRRFGPKTEVFAAVENLTDTDYRIHGSGLNEPGRNLILSAAYRY
jgi:outer membrane receptor protein involved in Fe transport